MSRNFDLMQEIESGYVSPARDTAQPVFPAPGSNNQGNGLRKYDDDGVLRLVQQVFLGRALEAPRMVVFAGVDHGNGCSRIATSIAETLAARDHRNVCLVEANFRSSALPAQCGPTNHRGLTDALRQDGPIRSFLEPVRSNKFWLLSSGSLAPDSPNLLSSDRLHARSMELRTEFDFVIVDAPPLTRYADAIALGQVSDGIVLVLEAESTRREAALMAVGNLRSSGIQILGAVLNKRTFPIPEKIYSRL